MLISNRLKHYMARNFNQVCQTTLNPKGPGSVRIHLVPPENENGVLTSSVAIVNGQDIIPVNFSWAILMCEFINQVNRYDGRELTDEDVSQIMDNTCQSVRYLFPLVPKKRIKKDIFTIMETFSNIAYNKKVDESIPYVNLGDYAQFMRAPHRMDIMVSAMTIDGTWHCNQKCVHCYAAGQIHAEEAELSTAQWKKILDILRSIGVPQVTFTGGEPTMRDDLPELIAYARWFVSRLNTNGIKLTKEYCHSLKEAELDSAQITFYSYDENIHNTLVGAKQYSNTVSGIENALSAGLSISINTPLCTLNKDYVKTLEFLKNKGVIYVTCSGLITTGNALSEKSESLQLSSDELKDILSEAVNYCNNNGMQINFTSPGWLESEFFDELGITAPTCGACLSNMAITPSGNVVPCQSWLSDEPLGNIISNSWSDIWNSPVCKKRRDFSSFMTGNCPLRREKNEK